MSELAFDREDVELGLGFLVDIAVHSARIAQLLEEKDDDDGEETYED